MMRELIVDSFAGGGGASEGIHLALGRGPDIAINHDREAIAMHAVNHPESLHLAEDVWEVDPVEATRGRPVGLMWLSPDCKHFSKAKGGKPVSKKVRGLAWVATRWAKAVAPRVIVLENVEEFKDWGPIGKKHSHGCHGKHPIETTWRDGVKPLYGCLRTCTLNKPLPTEKGKTFRRFIARLRNLGYEVDYRQLRACDFGAPTIRRRLFIIARRDGLPIVWPEPTHAKDGRDGLKPWRTAAECIDWSIPCPSIFARRKPLAENTLKRIARGMKRFVIDSPNPFIVNMAHGGKLESMAAPVSTIATEKGGCRAVVTPYVAGVGGRQGQSPERSVEQPLQTITSKADSVVVAPHLVPMQHENAPTSVEEPLQTVTTQGNKFNLVAPIIAPLTHHGENRARSLEQPLDTVTGAHRGEQALVSATLINTRNGEREGQAPRVRDITQPMPTVTGIGSQGALVEAFLAKNFGGNYEGPGASLDQPAPTVTTQDHNALVAASVVKLKGTAKDGQPLDEPLHTVAAGGQHHALSAAHISTFYGHKTDADVRGQQLGEPLATQTTENRHALVRAFLTAYYGNEQEGADLFDPMRTVTSKDRLGLVTVEGYEYFIADIGMRMLVPRELYRAQGFRDTYRIDIKHNGKRLSKTAQVRMVGNSVCPPLAAAIVRANLIDASVRQGAAA